MAREALLEGRLAAVRRSNMEAAKVLKEDEEDDGDLILLNLLDSAPCVATPNAAGGSGGGGGGGGGGVNKKAAKRAKEEVEQLSLQVTGLFRLALMLSRVEDMSHILVWGRRRTDRDTQPGGAGGHSEYTPSPDEPGVGLVVGRGGRVGSWCEIALIELPRLQVRVAMCCTQKCISL